MIWIIIDMGIEAVDEVGINLPSIRKEDHLFRGLIYKLKAY